MDLSPRSLSRAVPWLAAAIAVECAVALTMGLTGAGYMGTLQAMVHVPEIVFLLIFAAAVKMTTAGGVERSSAQRLLYGTYALLVVISLARFVDVDVYPDAPRGWLFLQALGGMLTAVAAPGLWGAALAREEDLSSTRITGVTRIHAKLTFAAVLLLVASGLLALLARGIVWIAQDVTAVGAFCSLIQVAGRGCLLWSAWESWRPAEDEIALRERARRIRILMIYSVAGSLGSAVLTPFTWRLESHGFGGSWYINSGMLIWHGVVQLTLTVLTAILVALALEAPERVHAAKRAPYFPEPPPPPRETGPIDVP